MSAEVVPQWLQITVAAAAVIGFLVTIISKITKSAVKYVDDRDTRVHDRLAVAIERGDSALATALDRLTAQLHTMSSQYETKIDALSERMDAALYQLEHVNDGSTVKGALVEVRAGVVDLENRISNVEGDVWRHHPSG